MCVLMMLLLFISKFGYVYVFVVFSIVYKQTMMFFNIQICLIDDREGNDLYHEMIVGGVIDLKGDKSKVNSWL